MKSVTEFQSFVLNKAVLAKAALTTEGKTPEEITASLGETFKYTEEKLKHFVAAVDVAASNPENLRRVLVVSLAEGEKAPAKAVQVEAHHYVPEFLILTSAKPEVVDRGAKRGGKDKKSGPKSSPWGMSPEELALKNKGGAKKQ